MKRQARRRHVLVWLLLAPLVGIGIALGLSQRPPEAISEGPIAIEETSPPAAEATPPQEAKP
ncbi:hypothetical protein [Algisphaera agarilytica]|uniref:Uncharacterized protein n=1 Tax=Algisphaera agarilytica TaxID=1385975 RepID=A0A7X0LMR5_9BACT|nr:hypothetical protein [Algisphaera agarilytica]MBB6431298.1 hypothetical protein [Algisphaera agarilytica]